MRKISRRQKEIREKTQNNIYSNLDEAIKLLKETATAKFVETVELNANLNIDPKYANQQLRTTVTLPNGVGKTVQIAVLTNEANFNEANDNGADIVGNEELIQDISQGIIDFDLNKTNFNLKTLNLTANGGIEKINNLSSFAPNLIVFSASGNSIEQDFQDFGLFNLGNIQEFSINNN